MVRAGYYYRKVAPRRVQRFRCLKCGCHFSTQSSEPTRYQKKPYLNAQVYCLLVSQVSQRRCALLLGIPKRTVVRKFRFLSRLAAIRNEDRRQELHETPVERVQFDDLITSLHTKCKPLSVSMAVDAKTREILGFDVSEIPARHPLREISLRKYGPRRNERPEGLGRLFRKLKLITKENVGIASDCDPEYPKHVERHFKNAVYSQHLSKRARSAGFGELKGAGFDPLFSINHTFAMLRANLNRLARRTWCTTKTKIGLIQHLELYAHFHNSRLIRLSPV